MSSASAAETVRPMEAADVRGVAAIERSAFSTPWTAATFANLLHWTDRCDALVVDAEVAGHDAPVLAGYAVLRFVEEEGELVNIAIAEDFRGRGLGSLLLDAVVDRARQRGLQHLFLEVRRSNERATAMYERRGFQVVGVRRAYYTKPVEDAKIMLLRLFDTESMDP